MGRQGIDKMQQKYFDRPGMSKDCRRYVNSCISYFLEKEHRKLKFHLNSERLEFSDLEQVNHQKFRTRDSGYNQFLILDLFIRLEAAVACQTAKPKKFVIT